MKKIIFPQLIFLTILFSCNQEVKQNTGTDNPADINNLLGNYYEERLQLFPLEATGIADNRYNDQLPCDISDSYREKLKVFFKKYLNEISTYDRSKLKGQNILSYDVFKREMEMQ